MPRLVNRLGLVLVAAISLHIAHTGHAEDRNSLASTTGTPVASWAKTDQTMDKGDIPDWLRFILSQQAAPHEPGDEELDIARRQILVFQDNGRPTYVASTWGPRHFPSILTIDRVTDRENLERLLTLHGGHMTIVEPSGNDGFPDHVPALFVDDASGGSAMEGYSQHIIRLQSGVRESGPPFRTLWAERRGDALLALSSDDRWTHFFFGCGGCGPAVPLVSVWDDGAFRPACRQQPLLLEQKIADSQRYLDKRRPRAETKIGKLFAADALLEIVLIKVQLGRFAEAESGYAALVAWLRADPDFAKDGASNWASRMEQAVRPVMDEASRHPERQCLLSETGLSEAHPGEQSRIEHFRYPAGGKQAR